MYVEYHHTDSTGTRTLKRKRSVAEQIANTGGIAQFID
jgi:hypothetical protein